MWEKGWRKPIWNELNQEWDIVVIGGGITGAGVFRRAVAEGYKTLLVEAEDFSFGTSSRSSKLVHGGIRYLRNRQFGVSREAVHEREWMLREAKNLVTPLGFLMPYYQNWKIKQLFGVGVLIYDLLAPKWKHSHYSKQKLARICPLLNSPELGGGYNYYDAEIDDSRLVITLLREAVRVGGTALNYARVENLLKDSKGRVCGVAVSDQAEGMPAIEVKASVVINATGPWGDEIRRQIGARPRLRTLRGSHLVFSHERLPLPQAISLVNPRDNRAMFAIPWEGVSLIGTTDLDQAFDNNSGEPFASRNEIEYLLDFINAIFPSIEMKATDILSSFAGLRPVINTGKANPSQESRGHVVWDESGLITITGGKLTTFRIMAEQALQKAAPMLKGAPDFNSRKRYFDPLPESLGDFKLSSTQTAYLLGRYGVEAAELLEMAEPGENQPIGYLSNLWSELRYNARSSGAIHLDDILLRRVRLGILQANGASELIPTIRKIVQPEMGWNDVKWQEEEMRYQSIYRASYAPSPTGKFTRPSGEIKWPEDNNALPHGMKDAFQTEPIA
ncbi:glycerol-3-phosphate dehydrogenase/oxidase, partial [bacterium]|nr:glycerol-3-phosphate dehydrogenase/oxidase [bacterium]